MLSRQLALGMRVMVISAFVIALTGCTDGGAPTPTGPHTSIAPGVEPTDKGEEPKPDPAEAVLSIANIDINGEAVSASGYVQGVIENGGTCAFTFSGDGAPVTRPADGLADSSTTTCGTVSVPVSELSSGTWSVALTYTSAKAGKLTSPALTVEVP